MADEEIFYDSLEEDDGQDFFSCPVGDLSETVPLYSGETPKDQIITQAAKKKPEKPSKPIPCPHRRKKSYLEMYYDKVSRKECKNDTNGSNTSRAVCDKLSPKRESDLDVDLNSIQSRSHTDTESDQDE
jgi:hypothetical protein